MSFLDRARQAFGQARNRAGRLADEHGDRIDEALNKGSSFLDERTKGKYAGRIQQAREGAKDAADRLAEQRHAAPPASKPPEPASHVEAPEPIEPPEPIDPPEPLDRKRP